MRIIASISSQSSCRDGTSPRARAQNILMDFCHFWSWPKLLLRPVQFWKAQQAPDLTWPGKSNKAHQLKSLSSNIKLGLLIIRGSDLPYAHKRKVELSSGSKIRARSSSTIKETHWHQSNFNLSKNCQKSLPGFFFLAAKNLWFYCLRIFSLALIDGTISFLTFSPPAKISQLHFCWSMKPDD